MATLRKYVKNIYNRKGIQDGISTKILKDAKNS